MGAAACPERHHKEVQEATLEALSVESANVIEDEETVDMLKRNLMGCYTNVVKGIVANIENPFPAVDFDEVTATGKVCGLDHMGFWRSVVQRIHAKHALLSVIVPVAAMCLALPASEAIDETVFRGRAAP